MEKLITAIIITKNEEIMLPGCLCTLDWVDEILVVDTGNTDNTNKIAKKAGARVVMCRNGVNFSDFRNKGLYEAKGKWVFYVDADERVPDALMKEILDVAKSESKYSWFVMPRSNIVFGKVFRHGGFWPDYVKRLFLKKDLKGWGGDLHEEPQVNGEMGYLKNYLLHEKHETIFEMVEKTNGWSEVEGKLMFSAHHPPMNIFRFVSAMAREFWKRMVIGMAFLDGFEGVIMAIYQVYSRFCSYAKLWEMQQKEKLK